MVDWRRGIIGGATALCLAVCFEACVIDISKGPVLARDAEPDDSPAVDSAYDATPEDGPEDAADGAEEGYQDLDGAPEAEDDAPGDVVPEERTDIPDADEEEPAVECGGVLVGGYCWYVGEANGSCTDACALHGGCSLAGTRDYAGSGGTDEHCVAVLYALGYGDFPHQSYANNDLGCHFAWGSYTYWATAYETTCEADMTVSGPDPGVLRMCACER
jgi:hypothetical protein